MSTQWLWLATTVLALYVLRRLALPKPVPGIPYNIKSVNRLLGDIPDVLKYIQDTGEVASFIPQKAGKAFGTPMFQLFMRPFARPWIIITDFRETQDIILRRTREFDRSDFFRDIFHTLVPGSMVHMSTDDTWRAQRKLVGNTMTPSFLENVSAPSIYSSGQALIGLWREKARLAQGRPFDVKEDLYRSGLDTIWAVAFGNQIGATRGQLERLLATDRVEVPITMDREATFPMVEEPAAFKSILALAESLDIPVSAALPRFQHWLALNLQPSLIRATRHKDRLIEEKIDEAVRKFSKATASDNDVECALDHVIHREVQQASKDNRPANPKSLFIKDELFAFMIAGHDTSATTLLWGLKLLTDNQGAQNKLRQHLFAEFEHARKTNSMPTVKNIYKSKIPYLEATLEEIYRMSGTSSAIFRKATTDAVVLGHVIPKGTDVCMVTFGPDFVEPSLPIDESTRSASSQEAKSKSGVWDPVTVRDFRPERWLKSNAAGEIEFDPKAGPSLLFGGGMRGCFGRKLAELQLKILLTLIIWNFELEETPIALSSYKSKDGITHAPRQCYLRLVRST
ncbi:hypothetical protein AMS68_001035 [Peltaster fructicola]|uniref:Cytochrome P450 n=1 Tax=Peltaster fructicola TaxID=286661 RepID=A0A6H0XLL6_9PEZI|nr:hypothetical protein AMS68_001035 [Peltaster fructicola]